MNLGDIESQVYDALNVGQNPDSPVQRRVRADINKVYRQVLTKKNIGPRLRRQLLSFVTSATSPFCVLPQAVARIYTVTDRTNNVELDEYTLTDIRYIDPGLQSSSAIPYAYVIMNLSAPVTTDPTAATNLTAVSDSATDGTGTAVNVDGVTSDGQLFRVSASMNGVTPIAVGAISTWLQITKFYLSSPAHGHVSLKDGSGNTLAIISPGRSFARYTRLHLYPTSSAVHTLLADVELRLDDMANTSDESMIPEDFHDILVEGAIALDLLRRGKFAEYGAVEGAKRKRTAELQVWMNKPTGTPRSSTTGQPYRRFSSLGPNFPSGT